MTHYLVWQLIIIILKILAVMLAWGALESLWNVAKFRASISILHKWTWFRSSQPSGMIPGTYRVDENFKESTFSPFHVLKGAASLLGLFSTIDAWIVPVIKSLFVYQTGYIPWLYSGAYLLSVGGLYYLVLFPVFYHIIWTRPEERDLHEQGRIWAWLYRLTGN